MRVSLKDIAEAAGNLSVAAVSLALRGSPEVSETTRERVRQIAEKMGYRPRVEISRLASRRWKNRGSGGIKVAFITHGTHRKSRMKEVVIKTAQQRGFDAEVFVIEDYSGGHQLGNVLWSRGIEALVTTWLYNKTFVDEFPWEKFTGVVVESGYYAPPLDIIYPDVMQCGCGAWREAVRYGRRNIGFAWIAEPVPPIDMQDKEAAFLLCRQEGKALGVKTERKYFPVPLDKASFLNWIDTKHLDAVLGQTPGIYFNAENEFKKRNIGFASINTEPIEKNISGYVLSFDRLMTRAWQEIEFQLRNFQRGFPDVRTRILVSLHWNEGLTLPCSHPPMEKQRPAAN